MAWLLRAAVLAASAVATTGCTNAQFCGQLRSCEVLADLPGDCTEQNEIPGVLRALTERIAANQCEVISCLVAAGESCGGDLGGDVSRLRASLANCS
mmetsp:Transcript_84982/g.248981  ORF Transcript_84982/g.248981 Transcript_84982/m.248981 type:complete len:97 (-) Transcript_84982:61-351(-)